MANQELPQDFKEFLRLLNEIDSVPVRLIPLSDLRRNKRASGRPKDLDDLEHLPSEEERQRAFEPRYHSQATG
jgi:hypothetical protein